MPQGPFGWPNVWAQKRKVINSISCWCVRCAESEMESEKNGRACFSLQICESEVPTKKGRRPPQQVFQVPKYPSIKSTYTLEKGAGRANDKRRERCVNFFYKLRHGLRDNWFESVSRDSACEPRFCLYGYKVMEMIVVTCWDKIYLYLVGFDNAKSDFLFPICG